MIRRPKAIIGGVGQAALSLALLLGSAQIAQSTQRVPASHQRVSELKSTAPSILAQRKMIIQSSGGLDVVATLRSFGMTPKEYGMLYGNGKSRKGKTNMLRVSKRARMKRKSN